MVDQTDDEAPSHCTADWPFQITIARYGDSLTNRKMLPSHCILLIDRADNMRLIWIDHSKEFISFWCITLMRLSHRASINDNKESSRVHSHSLHISFASPRTNFTFSATHIYVIIAIRLLYSRHLLRACTMLPHNDRGSARTWLPDGRALFSHITHTEA